MTQWCKHLAIRLWATLTVGGVTALLALPPFAAEAGPAWMVLPGIGLLAVAYWSTGFVFTAVGNRRINRLMDEARVWERAGMPREARQLLVKALKTIDGFLFSPSARREPAKRLLAQTARFQMAQAVTDLPADAVVEAYLLSFPQDRAVAVRWLENLLIQEMIPPQAHDVVGRIKEAHEHDAAVLQRVARFFLKERCCDLTALQTYRALVDAGDRLPGDLIDGMADLFLAQSRVDSVALQVYLARYERGEPTSRLLQGIAACRATIAPDPRTRSSVNRAEEILSGVSSDRRDVLAASFALPTEDAQPYRSQKPALQDVRAATRAFFHRTRRAGERMVALVSTAAKRRWDGIKRSAGTGRFRQVLKWTLLSGAVAAVVLLVINTIVHLSSPPLVGKAQTTAVVLPVSDPFTIQVAAYLEETDARAYAKRLIGEGMDAYWTQASGGGKTWFQVRVSHFPTKAAAKAFGEKLKAQGVIDDYYVANYQRAER